MLTDAKVKAAKPRTAAYKLYDERGLHLFVSPTGARSWRLKYVNPRTGKEGLISFGLYPDVSLAEAREHRDEARKLVAKKIDPSAKRKAERTAQAENFEAVAREYLEITAKSGNGKTVDAGTIDRMRRRLERYVFPHIGKQPIANITAPDLLSALRRIENKGSHETAHRTRSACGRIFRYAIATGRAERDVAADLQGALAPVESKNFAAITDPKRVGELLRAIDGYQGEPATMAALKLAPLVFVRPGELRAAEWSEFDFTATIQVGKQTRPAPEWRIPAERMKMRERHIVPLATQAVAILEELRKFTGERRFLFPGTRGRDRYLSENTLGAALRRLDFLPDEMTAHGFRSTASTLLNELGFPGDVIERQLAHAPRDKIRAAYNRAELLAERRTMMQAWADYLDGLKADRREGGSQRFTGRDSSPASPLLRVAIHDNKNNEERAKALGPDDRAFRRRKSALPKGTSL